jgi:hypothetical protein
MSLTKVSYSMISDNVINVLDYGATGNGTTDDSVAIQAAITAANNLQIATGLTPRTIVFFPAGVYLCKSTLTCSPFINYVGVRATTADTGATFSTLTSSRGSIIRAHTDIYTNAPTTLGTLCYVPTGDITFRDLTFVGTASINSNSSIAVQWGSSGTGRPFETSTTGVVSGVVVEDCSFYTCTAAWDSYTLNDSYFYQCRFESNVTAISFGYNLISNAGFQAQFYGCVWFASSIAVAFSSASMYEISFIGGSFEGTTDNSKHIYSVNAAPNANYRLKFSGVSFSHVSSTGTANFYMAGYFQGGTNRTIVSDCMFSNGQIYFAAGSGSTGFSNWAFNNCTYFFVPFNMSKCTRGTINGGSFYDSPISLDNSSLIDIHDAKFEAVSSGYAIDLSTINCGDNRIYNNYFNNNSGNINVANSASNASTYFSNNKGISISPVVGVINDTINGITFTNLGAPNNGSTIYCPDGTIASPVAGGGTGCFAKRLNGVWVGN